MHYVEIKGVIKTGAADFKSAKSTNSITPASQFSMVSLYTNQNANSREKSPKWQCLLF